MISFPNAKINIGLRITERRPDGYHNLETVFHPVGLYAGTPLNPVSFCDTLEVVPSANDEFRFKGRPIDCPLEKNLVYKAVMVYREELKKRNINPMPVSVTLEKNLPDGAGLGGGSADASFTLKLLDNLTFPGDSASSPFTADDLERMALRLGADCPVFIRNQSCYAEGVGEKMTPVSLGLAGMWCVIVKPEIYVSTREAFAGVRPHKDNDAFPLNRLGELPKTEWKDVAVNDFEASLFPAYPRLGEIMQGLYDAGAFYASMSGSGSSQFGLFESRETATRAASGFASDESLFVRLLML